MVSKELLPVQTAYLSITALPIADDVNSSHTALVRSSKTAYKLLSTHQRSLLSDADIVKYESVIAAYDKAFPTPIVPNQPTPNPNPINPETPIVDSNNTGVTITVPSQVTNVANPVLNVYELQGWSATSQEFARVSSGFTLVKTFMINLYDSTTKVTQVEGGKVKVEIPFIGTAGKAYIVLRYNDDKTITEFKTTYVNGKISFETDHFSTYAIAVKAVVTPDKKPTTPPKTGDTTPISACLALAMVACVLILTKKLYLTNSN